MLRLSDFVMDRKKFHNLRRGLFFLGLEDCEKLKFRMGTHLTI